MRTISSNKTTVLPLGKQGENLAEKIIFTDPISWLKGYGPGTVQLLNQRPGEDTPYPVVISEESDGSYSWAVTAADTALAGQGKCELRYLSGDTVVKSLIWSTIVNDALGEPSDTPPESQQGWVDQVLAAGTSAQDAAKRAEAAAINQPYPNEETGTWWVWDAEAGAYRDTGISYGAGSSVELDTTLKEAGKAADAAAVGARFDSLSEEIANVADAADALVALSECSIITPAYQDGTFYTDADGAIHTL